MGKGDGGRSIGSGLEGESEGEYGLDPLIISYLEDDSFLLTSMFTNCSDRETAVDHLKKFMTKKECRI